MAQGNFLAGAFKRGAQIFDRQDPTIEVSTEHSNFFVKTAALEHALANPNHPAVRTAINLSEDFRHDYEKHTKGHYDYPTPLERPYLTREAVEELINFSRKGYFQIS